MTQVEPIYRPPIEQAIIQPMLIPGDVVDGLYEHLQVVSCEFGVFKEAKLFYVTPPMLLYLMILFEHDGGAQRINIVL